MSARAYKSERHMALNSSYPSDSRRASFYTPAPARRVNLWRAILRAIWRAL